MRLSQVVLSELDLDGLQLESHGRSVFDGKIVGL